MRVRYNNAPIPIKYASPYIRLLYTIYRPIKGGSKIRSATRQKRLALRDVKEFKGEANIRFYAK